MRLFTFGCSLTNYYYPTWSNIIAEHFEHYQNWGKPGAGNNYILAAITRAHLKNTLGPGDTVIVMWSGLARTDYYQINQWCHVSNNFHDMKTKHLPYSCPLGYQWLSYSWMAAAQHTLTQLGVSWKMFAWQPQDHDTAAAELYGPVLAQITPCKFVSNTTSFMMHAQARYMMDRELANLYQRLAGADWPSLSDIMTQRFDPSHYSDYIQSEIKEFMQLAKANVPQSHVFDEIDQHPGPMAHLRWVETYLPEYPISRSMFSMLEHVENCLINQENFDFVANEYQ